MRTKFIKILSIFMAFFVMFSTTSFVVDFQFCKDSLEDISFIHQSSCCGAGTTSNCDDNLSHKGDACHNEIDKGNCCSLKQVSNTGLNQADAVFNEISLNHQVFLTSFIYTYFHFFENYNSNSTSFRDYIPPLIIRDVYKFKEVYLI